MAEQNFTTAELETEEWRDVVGYEGLYSVSNRGRVKRVGAACGTKTGRILRPRIEKGYFRLNLYKDRAPKHHNIHRLVIRAFAGLPLEGQREVNHKNGQKLDNRIENLEYCTRGQNALHAAAHGLLSNGAQHGALVKARTPRGTRNHAAKLTEDDVLEIRRRYTGKRGEQRLLGREFGVDSSLIGLIVKRRIWIHI